MREKNVERDLLEMTNQGWFAWIDRFGANGFLDAEHRWRNRIRSAKERERHGLWVRCDLHRIFTYSENIQNGCRRRWFVFIFFAFDRLMTIINC